jgi:hypothetical protein
MILVNWKLGNPVGDTIGYAKIDEHRYVEVHPHENGVGLLATNGSQETKIAFTYESAEAIFCALGCVLGYTEAIKG